MSRYPVLVAIVLLVCCSRPQAASRTSPPISPIPLAEAKIKEIIPVADGGAYLTTYKSDLWYVRGGNAVRVHFDSSHGKTPNKMVAVDIVPSVDGGAYASFPTDKTLWYLQQGEARRIVESTAITTQASPSTGGNRFFGLYTVELKARRAAEKELASLDEEPERDDDYE